MNIIKDIFDKKILKYTILPFMVDLIFWLIIFIFFSNNIIEFLESIISFLPFGEKIENILANIGGIILIIVIYYVVVIATLGIFTSFYIDKIVLRINELHYNCNVRKISFKDTLHGIFISIKSFIIYLIVFIFTFYLLFIPIINIFYHMFMMSILNKKPLTFDSSYLFFDSKEIEKKYNFAIWVRVFLSSFIYLIPIISLFGYTFQLIIMTNFILKQCKN